MHPGVQLSLVCSSLLNATRVRDAVQARIDKLTLPVLRSPLVVIPWHDDESGNPRWQVNATLVCLTESEADQLYADIVALWTSGVNAGRTLAGSAIKRYNDWSDTRADEDLYQAEK